VRHLIGRLVEQGLARFVGFGLVSWKKILRMTKSPSTMNGCLMLIEPESSICHRVDNCSSAQSLGSTSMHMMHHKTSARTRTRTRTRTRASFNEELQKPQYQRRHSIKRRGELGEGESVRVCIRPAQRITITVIAPETQCFVCSRAVRGLPRVGRARAFRLPIGCQAGTNRVGGGKGTLPSMEVCGDLCL
jgi:hypothetical protein